MNEAALEEELLQIKERKSFQLFDRICPGIELFPFQSVSVFLWLYNKRGGFIFDPGMGKTFTIAAGMRALCNSDNTHKFLFFIKKSQIIQTANDIRAYTDLRVVTCTAEQEEISVKMYLKDTSSYDVFMLTHEILDNPACLLYLYSNISKFTTAIVDEAHNLLNYVESNRAFVMASILPRFERVALLTATPIVTNPASMSWFMYMIDSGKFENTSKLLKLVKEKRRFDLEFPLHIYNYDRKSEGIENSYDARPVWIKPHDFQREARGDILLTNRGPGSFNQIEALLRTIRRQISKNKRGIVFVYNHEVREFVLPYLDQTGVRYGCINGKTSSSDDYQVQMDFAAGKLDIVVLSVATALNLDCDYVYLYQYTVELKQIIGRAERGLSPKIIEIFFPFTEGTRENDYFLRNIYRPSRHIRSIIGKEYTEFLEMGEYLLDR